jgi:hypothetical protein
MLLALRLMPFFPFLRLVRHRPLLRFIFILISGVLGLTMLLQFPVRLECFIAYFTILLPRVIRHCCLLNFVSLVRGFHPLPHVSSGRRQSTRYWRNWSSNGSLQPSLLGDGEDRNPVKHLEGIGTRPTLIRQRTRPGKAWLRPGELLEDLDNPIPHSIKREVGN